VGGGPEQEEEDRQPEHRHDDVLRLDRPVGALPDEEGEDSAEGEVEQRAPGPQLRPLGDQRLRRAEDVEGNRQRLGDEEREPDRRSEAGAEHPADQVVGAAAAHFGVGGDGCDGERGGKRDARSDSENEQRIDQPGAAEHVVGPHEHDQPENGQQSRGVDAGEGSEIIAAGRGRRGAGIRPVHGKSLLVFQKK